MNPLANLTRIARWKSDPVIEQEGPSSLTAADRLSRNLGWFSIGLGVFELVAAEQITRFLGLKGRESLVRAYGVRELAAAIPTLSVDKHVGLAARVAGDVLDIATLAPALSPRNRKRGNAELALLALVGVTMLDIIALKAVLGTHARSETFPNYADRSGLPKGLAASRGIGKPGA